jgi:hypothetical protein
MTALNALPQAKAILKWKAMALYAGGLIYGIEDENGVFTQKKDSSIEEFFWLDHERLYYFDGLAR